MYSMAITANNTESCTWMLLREILNSLTTKKKRQLCQGTEVLANATVLISLQYVNVWNQYIGHLKLMQCCASTVSQ